MAVVLLAVLLVLPFLEVWCAVAVAGMIGPGWTILALVVLSALGLFLVKREGMAVWRRVNAEVASGRIPTRSLVDGAVGLAGAVLLVVPGFLTAALGLMLWLPPTRAMFRPLALRWLQRRVSRAGVMNAVFVDKVSSPTASARRTRSPWGSVIGGTIVDVDLRESGVTVSDSDAEIIDVEVDDPPELPPGRQ